MSGSLRSFLLLLLLGVPAPVDAAVEAPADDATTNSVSVVASGDLLQFIDGSSLHGQLVGMDPALGVEWRSPVAKSLIDFRPTNLAWVRFEKPVAPTSSDRPSCRFRFQNGDEVFGNLLGMNGDDVELETWFGRSLKTSRANLQAVTFLSKGYAVIYEGPTSPEGWVEGRTPKGWEYRDGAFVATGSGTIGRDLHLSGSCSLGFDLAWNGQFSMILALYTSVFDRFDYSTSSYMFYLSPSYVTLQRVQGGAGPTSLGQTAIAELGRKNRVHIEIRANKEDASLALLADDRLVQRWKDNAGFVGQGSGLVFFAQMDGPSIRISNLKVAQWQGEFGAEGATNAPGKDDLVYLVNRDRVTGHLQNLQDGKLAVATGQTQLSIPLPRVSQISFAHADTNAAPTAPWELRAYFAGGGSVAFDLAKWKSGQVSGVSRNFGPVHFDPRAIRQIQFNLARSKQVAEDMEILDQEVWDIE